MSKYGTSFNETEALLAASEGDEEEVDRILRSMYTGELISLRRACEILMGRIQDARGRFRQADSEE